MTILILGCGWVGEEYAMRMLHDGHQVYVSVTSTEKSQILQAKGLHTFVFDFDKGPVGYPADFPLSFDYVLNSIPASNKFAEDLLTRRFTHLGDFLSELTYTKHIFLSSIGVYPRANSLYVENTPADILNPRLFGAEVHMSALRDTVVYRLGGLFGKNRIFAKYFAGKVCTTGSQPSNFIHLEDVVRLISLGFAHLTDETYNLVCPEHPLKKDVVVASAKRYGYGLPSHFEVDSEEHKVVSSSKIIEALDYQFVYASPLDF